MKKVKRMFLGKKGLFCLNLLVLGVINMSFSTNCWWLLHQPEVPKQLTGKLNLKNS